MAEITHDPSTWPCGDRLWSFARAIAIAEGANIPGSVPDRFNNPGDLSDGYTTFGGEEHDGSQVTHFPDKQHGWDWLRNKLYIAWKGHSKVYNPEMSFVVFAQKWAGNWQPWVKIVTKELNVPELSKVGDYLDGQ